VKVRDGDAKSVHKRFDNDFMIKIRWLWQNKKRREVQANNFM
jgi:hypothetical protein